MVVRNPEPGVAGPPGKGDVTGPAVAVDGDVTSFDGVTGKKIKDSGIPAAHVVVDNLPERFRSSEALVPSSGGVNQPIGSTELQLFAAGRIGFGALPLFDANAKRNMKPGYDPDSFRLIAGAALDALAIGDPPELVLGRRYGDPWEVPATSLLVTEFVAGVTEVITIKWDPAFEALWVAEGLNLADLPAPNAPYDAGGRLQFENPAGSEHFAVVEVTGKEGLNKLKVSKVVIAQKGAANFPIGEMVTQLLAPQTTLGLLHADPWLGQGGYQDRSAAFGFQTTEYAQRTTDNGYQAGGKVTVTPTTMGEGKDSTRRESMEWESDGSVLLFGGYAEDSTLVAGRLTVGGPWARLGEVEGDPASGNVEVGDSLAGWPTGGTHFAKDGAGNEFSYTGITLPKTFTGTAVVAGGKLAKLAKIKLATREKFTDIAARGGQIAANFGQGVAATSIGNIGPTATAPEGGWLVNGDAGMWRLGAEVIGTTHEVVGMEGGSNPIFAGRDSAAPTQNRWELQRFGKEILRNAAGTVQAELHEVLGSGNAGVKVTGRFLANAASGGIGTEHVAAATPTGGTSGEIKIGNGKIWANDAGTWKSVAIA